MGLRHVRHLDRDAKMSWFGSRIKHNKIKIRAVDIIREILISGCDDSDLDFKNTI